MSSISTRPPLAARPLALPDLAGSGANWLAAKAELTDAEDLKLSCYLSEDFQDGVRAFLDKRPANWQGR